MSVQEKYPSSIIEKASQFELQQMLAKFKQEYISTYKFLGFALYNFVALSGLVAFSGWFIKTRWVKRGEKGKMKKKQLTLVNIVKRGSKVSLLIGGVYMTGLALYVNYMMPLSVFKKYTQIQQSLHAFEIKFDPFYQDLILFKKMRRFGLPQSLIDQIKADLNNQKSSMIQNKKLKQDTIALIHKSEQMYKAGIYQSKNLLQ